jgi:3-carboxy-cis,cis-muconate cycloisomerase
MQTEIGEAFEPAAEGRGGSSTLPQKRNPVGCAAVLSAAVRVPALVSVMLSAMVQENERGMGNWHAEWETLPEICALASGALMHMMQVLKGLELDATRMTGNLEVTQNGPPAGQASGRASLPEGQRGGAPPARNFGGDPGSARASFGTRSGWPIQSGELPRGGRGTCGSRPGGALQKFQAGRELEP